MRSTENKVIVSANVRALESTYRSVSHCAQRGFVPGRNLLANIVDIDAAGRIFTIRHHAELSHKGITHVPVPACYDFDAAFPSVIYEWLWLVLKVRRVSLDFRQLCKTSLLRPKPCMNTELHCRKQQAKQCTC